MERASGSSKSDSSSPAGREMTYPPSNQRPRSTSRQRFEQKGKVRGRPSSSPRQLGQRIAAAISQPEPFLPDPELLEDDGLDVSLEEDSVDFLLDVLLDVSLGFLLEEDSLEEGALSALASFL